MLHSIKAQGNWPFGSIEEDFEEFLPFEQTFVHLHTKKAREYDQEIPQSHTADKTTTEH